nr:hypothetical protein [Tanacetum cinerariifolium]
MEINTIEDGKPVQRRSSSRPPKPHESSSGAARRQYSAAPRSSSVHAVGGLRTSSSNTNNSMHPTQMTATPRSEPLPTIPILSGIRSSSNTIGLQVDTGRRNNDNIHSIGPELFYKACIIIVGLPGPDPKTRKIRLLLYRVITFTLLEPVYILNSKDLKVDDYTPNINIPYSEPNHSLINSNDNETLIDETCKMPLSMSHAGGNVNHCKTRILKFVKEAHSYPVGNAEILVSRSETKLILSERKSDGTVTMHYCNFDDYD